MAYEQITEELREKMLDLAATLEPPRAGGEPHFSSPVAEL